jgi:hypothetical protein
MLNQKVTHLSRKLGVQLAAACGTGLLLGGMSFRFSPTWTLVISAGGALAFIILKRPEVGVLCLLIATSSVVGQEALPSVPGLSILKAVDVAFAVLTCLIPIRQLAEPDFKVVRTPLDLPLLSFCGAVALSTVTAVLRSSVEMWAAALELRIVSYYLIFFVVTNLVREKHQIALLLRGFLGLATVVATMMIAQYVLGESRAILPGRVETLLTLDTQYGGVTRILPPGQSLILVAFIVITAVLAAKGAGSLNVLTGSQWSLLGLALVFTFCRAFWVAAALALSLLGCLTGKKNRQRLVGWGLIVLFLATIVLLPTLNEPNTRAARLIRASLERLNTFDIDKTAKDSSLQWRNVENEYAFSQIASHLLIGLGLGARYRPFDPRLPEQEKSDLRAYIHNGHLWILMKSGLLGYLCLMWLSLAFVLRGFRYWRVIPDPQMRAAALGFTLTYLVLLFVAITHPIFMQSFWVPVIGVMMGLNEVIFRENGLGQITRNSGQSNCDAQRGLAYLKV